MKLWNNYRYSRIILALFVLAVFMAVLLISSNNILVPYSEIYNLEDGWDISVNGVRQSSDSLLSSGVGVIGYGDIVTISKELPDFAIDNPCIATYSIHAMIDVYLEDQLIYSYGRDYFFSNKTVPKHINYFSIGNDYAGKKLTIVLSGSRRNSFSGLSPVMAGLRSTLFTAHAIKMRHDILIGMFLIVLGCVLMVLSPYMVLYHNNDTRLFFSGLISLLLGIYDYSYYGLIDMISGKAFVNTVCEYSSIYNIPTAILGYLMSVYTGRLKKIFRALFFLNILVFIAVFLFCVIGTSRISDFMPLLHWLAFVEAIFANVVLIRDMIRNFRGRENVSLGSDTIFAIGLIIFMLLSIIDTVSYNLRKYFGLGDESTVKITGFLIGAIIFVFGLLISYILYIIYNANLDSMQNKITSLAYTDPLTGLANRARCEQVMDLLTQEHASYTIISMDLNKLKQVNDTLGHHEGDRLLSGFATILSDSFMDANLVGRMGGDEFIVILTEDRALNATRRIHAFYSLMNDWNHKEQMFQYSASYGYAYSYEVPSGSAQEVYMLADSRMYEMKKEHHNDDRKGVIVNA